MARMVLRLFGSFCLESGDGACVGFESDKVRSLLAYLGVERDRPHRREALAALLWPDQPPETAFHRLRQALTNLRQVVGDGGSIPGASGPAEDREPVLLVDRSAIQVNPAGGLQTDSALFEELLDACERHNHRSAESCRSCMERREQAVALYRGPFLTGMSLRDSEPFDHWASDRRDTQERRAMEALAGLSCHYERRGDHRRAAEYARRQLQLEPWREDAHRMLMSVLARSGRRSEALHQYVTCQETLQRELGIEPEPETRLLFDAISRGEIRRGPARRAHNLPAELTSFVGRADELARIMDLLQMRRLVSLTGTGGSGKTRLALRVARDLAADFPHGAWFVDLAGVTDSGLLADAVSAALGVPAQPDRPMHDVLLDHLRDREALVVLDNCEHLMEGCRPFVNQLLRECPLLCLLLTSREPLRVPAEAVLPVRALAVPSDAELSLGSVGLVPAVLRSEAVALFLDRAALHQDGAPALSARDLVSVAQVCRHLEGIPLALELAAPWASVLTLDELARRLRDRFALLENRDASSPARHRTLQLLIDWSYGLLREPEQALFRQLSVFSGGWDLSAAEAVCAPSQPVLPLLGRLVDKSLVIHENGRYRMLETLREYGRQRLAESREEGLLLRRHAEHFLAFAEARAGDHDRESVGFQPEISNLRAAVNWAWPQEAPEVFLRLAGAMGWYWYTSGSLAEGETWLRRALQSELGRFPGDPEVLRVARARAAEAASYVARRNWEFDRADDLLHQALACYDREREPRRVAQALRALAWTAAWQGKCDESERLRRDSMALFEGLKDRVGVAWCQQELGWMASFGGQYKAALGLLEGSLTTFGSTGQVRGQALALAVLGAVHLELGHLEKATGCLEEALTAMQSLGDVTYLCFVVDGFGRLALLQGEPGRALRLFGAADGLHARCRTRRFPVQDALVARWAAEASAVAGEEPREEGRRKTAEEAIAYALAFRSRRESARGGTREGGKRRGVRSEA